MLSWLFPHKEQKNSLHTHEPKDLPLIDLTRETPPISSKQFTNSIAANLRRKKRGEFTQESPLELSEDTESSFNDMSFQSLSLTSWNSSFGPSHRSRPISRSSSPRLSYMRPGLRSLDGNWMQPETSAKYKELLHKKKILLQRSEKFLKSVDRKEQPTVEIKPVSPDQASVVQKWWSQSPRQQVGIVNKVSLSVADLLTLKPRTWLNDSVIDAYLSYIAEQSDLNVFAWTTHFYTRLAETGGSGVARWAKKRKVRVFDLDVMLVPVNQNNMHWCVAVVDHKKKRLAYYDSLNGDGTRVLDNLQTYMVQEAERSYSDKSRELIAKLSEYTKDPRAVGPSQNNGSDCGVFVCATSSALARGDGPSYSQKDIPLLRENIAYILIEQARGKSNL